MTDIDDVLGAYRPQSRSVRVIVDGSVLAELDRLEDELKDAQQVDRRENRPPEAPGIARRIEELRAAAHASAVEFTFQAVGRRQWSDLLAQHPPTPEQLAEARAADQSPPEFNPETFPAAAVAASCTSPEGMTADKAQRIFDGWAIAQTGAIWSACLAANIGSVDIPFTSAASAVLRRSAENSPTAPQGESPDLSSSDGQ